MLKFDRQLLGPTGMRLTLRGALDWWTGELVALIPLPLRHALVPRRVILKTIGDEDGISLVRPEGDRLYLADHGPSVSASTNGGLQRIRMKRPEDAVICLAPDRALRTIATLPLAAQSNLGQVIAFEFERLVPFRRDESYFAYRLLGRNKATRSLRVELTVAPRPQIDALTELAESHGFRVVAVTVTGVTPDQPDTSLPFAGGDGVGRRSRARLAIGALSTLALLLAILCLAIPYVRQQHTLDGLTRQVVEARRRANMSLDLRKKIESQLSTQTVLVRRRNRTATVAELLNTVTRLTPDGTWLTEFRISGDRIELFGLSPSASNLLRLIDRSSQFREAAFASPVTRDARFDRERFAISARIARKGVK